MTHFSATERDAALRVGATMLRDRFPTVNCHAIVFCGPNVFDAYVSFNWPGVVRVTMRYTGALIAQSLPGRPFEIDPSASA